MVERIEDLNLPNSVITRLIKDALPDNTNVTKETRAAIGRAASVFIIFLTSTSTQLAQKENHKTITTANLFDSLKELEFGNFVKPLENDLEAYRKMLKEKKENKVKKDATNKTNDSNSSPAFNNTEDDEIITGN